MKSKENVRVNFGCGSDVVDGWLNFDNSPILVLGRYRLLRILIPRNSTIFHSDLRFGNIVKGLPLKQGSVDVVYSSHVLEHLTYNEGIEALRNCFEMMKKGAVMRLVMPDFDHYIDEYNKSKDLMKFYEQTDLGYVHRPSTIFGKLIFYLKNSRHQYVWNEQQIVTALTEIGFKDIRRAYFNDSECTDFNAVERFNRWDKMLGIECTK